MEELDAEEELEDALVALVSLPLDGIEGMEGVAITLRLLGVAREDAGLGQGQVGGEGGRGGQKALERTKRENDGDLCLHACHVLVHPKIIQKGAASSPLLYSIYSRKSGVPFSFSLDANEGCERSFSLLALCCCAVFSPLSKPPQK